MSMPGISPCSICGDAGVGDAQHVGQFGWGDPGGGPDLGEMVAADAGVGPFTSRRHAGGLVLGYAGRVPAPGLDVVPAGVGAAHRCPSSCCRVFRWLVYR